MTARVSSKILALVLVVAGCPGDEPDAADETPQAETPVAAPAAPVDPGPVRFDHTDGDFLFERVTSLLSEAEQGAAAGEDVTTACLAAAGYARELAAEDHPEVAATVTRAQRFCQLDVPMADLVRTLAALEGVESTDEREASCFLVNAKLGHVESFYPDESSVAALRQQVDTACP